MGQTDIEAPIRLLMVEDDRDSAQALKGMLERRGVIVRVVETAEEGFRAFRTGPLDVIVADIRLRGKSGIELLSDIRMEQPDFPVILLTGFDSLETAIQAVRLGAQDYILKPVDSVEDVLMPVAKAVRHHRLLLRNRALEQDLRTSEARFRTVLENSVDVIYRLNVKEGTFDYISPSARSLLGHSAAAMASLSLAEVAEWIHPEDREALDRMAREAKARRGGDARVEPVECRIRAAGNGYRWISTTNAFLFDAEGAAIAVVGSARDISERKRAETRERELREGLARVKRVEVLSAAAAALAHDLNHMLYAVMELPKMMIEDLEASGSAVDAASLKKHLIVVRDNAHQAGKLIRNVLALARRGSYELRPTSLNDAIEDYVGSPAFRTFAAAHPRVALQTRLSPDLARINGSACQLSQAIMNLVVNAYEALPDGGKLAIATANERVESELAGYEVIEPGEYAVLRVGDSGSGIDNEILYRVFEPFYSRKKQGGAGGTGLGLAIVHGVVKDHGGFIDVRSTVGKGTEFALYFPVS